MSASLVGSEMCIRDRRNCAHVPGALLRTSNAKHGIIGVPMSLLAMSGRAVSYTHLTLPTICSV
eukprot:826998-Alexandrium_andersonii.AAC.1